MTTFLLGYAVQAALMLTAGALAGRALRTRPAALRHLVWTLALAATLLLPLFSAALAAYRIELPLPGWSSSMPETGGPAAEAPPGAMLPERDRATVLPDPMAGSFRVSQALLGVWLLGSSLLLARSAAGRIALGRLARRARTVTADGVQEEAAAAAGCRRRVRLLTNERIPAPVAFGIFRPVVVLPAGWKAWPPARTRAVLLHELCHVARRDAAPQLLAEVVRALHWFDPLAWYAVRRLAAERERACDDAVLRSGVGSREYAAYIVEAAKEMTAHPRLLGALPITPRTDLESRLVAILDSGVPRARTTWLQRLRLLGAAGGCAGLLACLAVVPARAADPGPAYPLDDPRSEIVPAAASGGGAPALEDMRNDAEREAVRRLRAAAAHIKRWEGDLVRERAEWALSQARDGEAVAPLLDALEGPDWRIQAYAAWALGVAGDQRAAAPLRELLDHPVWRVRAQAVYSLLDLDAGLPEDRLPVLAADPAWQVRIGVVEYLSRRGGPGAVARLRVLAGDPHAGTRMTAAAALAEIRSAR